MQLNLNNSSDVNLIKSIDEDNITIGEKFFDESVIVSNQQIIVDLNLTDIDNLTANHIEQLLSSSPEIIIIGSGKEHTFPDSKLLNPIALENSGFEVMNNKSAARTYNILVAEERQVACLLVFE